MSVRYSEPLWRRRWVHKDSSTKVAGGTPPARRHRRLLAVLVSVLGWVVFLDGTGIETILVALGATVVTVALILVVQRSDLPDVFGVFLAASVLAVIPNLVAALGVSVQVGPAVVGALFIHLPGLAIVSSVIDGIAGAPVSAVSRGVGAFVTAAALALGMLAGTTVGASLGLTYTPEAYSPDSAGVPVLLSLVGAALGMAGLAIARGIPGRTLAPTVGIGSAAWIVVWE